MDTNITTYIDIDSRIIGNISSANAIKITHARIFNLEDFDGNFISDPSSLKTVICTGIISPHWFTTDLPRCRNLTRLVLCGQVLQCYTLTSGEHGVTQNYLIFPALTILEIIANEKSYQEPKDLFRISAYENYRNAEISLTISKNVAYLLNNIQAVKLRTLHIYVHERKGWAFPNQINWRFRPLETFLEFHRHSLRELFLPEFEGKCCSLHEPNRLYPQRIHTLNIMLSHYQGIPQEGQIQNLEYWKYILASQMGLTSLKLHLANFPDVTFFNQIMEALGFNSSGYLKHAFIRMETLLDCQIDGALFQYCDCLEILTIFFVKSTSLFINFSRLPRTLKKLSIQNCLIINPDPRLISQFYQLQMLQLHDLCLDPGMHDLSLEVIKQFLRLRSLFYLAVHFNENPDNNASFQKILDDLRLFWGRRYKREKQLHINDPSVTDNWEDDTFNDVANGRQDIYYIEPELEESSYESWYWRLWGVIKEIPYNIPLYPSYQPF